MLHAAGANVPQPPRGTPETRDLGEKEDDQDTVDLLTGVIAEFEKHVWFLRASLEG